MRIKVVIQDISFCDSASHPLFACPLTICIYMQLGAFYYIDNSVIFLTIQLATLCFLRAKSARVITFEQFNQALVELAPKRFKGKDKEEALQQLYGLIVGKEPANAGITVSIES